MRARRVYMVVEHRLEGRRGCLPLRWSVTGRATAVSSTVAAIAGLRLRRCRVERGPLLLVWLLLLLLLLLVSASVVLARFG